MIRLSPRLQLLLDLAPEGEPLWDFCCDHGLLGLRALETRRFPEVHFVDQVPHIMDRLRSRLGEQPGAFVHLLDAGELLGPVGGTVIVAGIGGERMLGILSRLKERGALVARTLVLCPQKDERDFALGLERMFAGDEFAIETPVGVREGSRERLVWRVSREIRQ